MIQIDLGQSQQLWVSKMSSVINMLSRETGLSSFAVRRIMQTAPLRYKVFYIPKKNGTQRRISQPSREVKLLQRIMLDNFLSGLPIHHSATAYRVGVGIYRNAQTHEKAGSILKMDFKDFFPSIKKSDWVLYCRKNKILETEEDIELTANLSFQKQREYRTLRLAIGAPTSPAISNIIMYPFDETINSSLDGRNITYSRYADDLTFSAPRVGFLKGIQTLVRKNLRSLEFPKIKVNEEKTIVVTKKYRRIVTGLVITNDGRISVGKERRRAIRAAIHWAKLGKLDESKLKQLSGMLSFVNSIESAFIDKMRHHYGDDLISYIMSSSGRRHLPKGGNREDLSGKE